MKFQLILNCLMLVEIFCDVKIEIDFSDATKEMKKLPRFWTNVGFSPPEPVDKVDEYMMNIDVHRNLEIIGSLPNKGIENVRIHWLLNLIKVKSENFIVFKSHSTFIIHQKLHIKTSATL